MLFKMTADVEFYAENLDDAFIKISNHFKNLIDSESSDHEVVSLFVSGSIDIKPIDNQG